MKQVSKASQLNKSVKQVSLASQVKQVGLASQVSNLPKSSQESEIKKVLVKQVQVKQVKSSKFKLSNLNQASEVMLDRDTAPRKRPSTRLSGKTKFFQVDTLPGTNISPLKGTFEDDVFSRWDMLVAWRVRSTLSSFFQASQYRRQSRNPIETRHWVQTSCKAKHGDATILQFSKLF